MFLNTFKYLRSIEIFFFDRDSISYALQLYQ